MSENERMYKSLRNLNTEAVMAAITFFVLSFIPIFTDGYATYILPQYMTFGLLAMSLAILWGYTGILSFGQAGFFAIGGYVVGIMLANNSLFGGLFLTFMFAVAIACLIAAILGYFFFSAGVRDAYFVIVTLAFSIVIEQLSVSHSQLTGGWNGLFVTRPTIDLGFTTFELFDDVLIYYLFLAFMITVYIFLYAFSRSSIGKVLIGIGENEPRINSLGIKSNIYKTIVFAISGGIASFAGGLYALHSGFVSPSLGGVLFSTEVVVWVAIAGRKSLIGALLGGIIVSYLSNFLSALTPAYWQLFIGLIFIATIAFFRGGVVGAVENLIEKQWRFRV
ncbi:MAG: branched-chain amino acid ABC transporter permease [Rhodospirillaceae bacterium]|jgi:urea transport system permease protein|nr:branched-chain amino acid ABC transporter permease [Rhodospirillaceae bacterium]